VEFAYHNPKSVQELVETLNGLQSYALLAGGTDLLVKMKEKLLRPMPQAIVDMNRIEGLQEIEEQDGCLRIGALVSHNTAIESSLIKNKAGILAEAASQVGSPQIRNMGTIVGNICNASPAADTVPALLVLDGTAEVYGPGGRQDIPLTELFQGPGRTSLAAGQFISQIKVRQIQTGEGAAFLKIGKRKALAIAVINCAVWLKITQGAIEAVRIAMGSVAPTSIRLYAVEQWLVGKPANEEVFAQAGLMAAQMLKPIDDVRSTARYRTGVARVIVYRSLAAAFERSQGRVTCE
jgi:carbon-monoxide dehydrogenase medium subunit